MTNPTPQYGNPQKRDDVSATFLSGPAEILVKRVLEAMGAIPQFAKVFGPIKDKDGQFRLRWADYARWDWSIRELPAINVYESGSENKLSENSFLDGSLSIQVFWPASFRRSDFSRIPRTFASAIENFFASDAVYQLLDPHPSVNVATKVPGLNELGRYLNWSPNTEGLIDSELVPVTMLEIKYRVDLRAWYRFLEFDDRTKADPFNRTLDELSEVFGEYDGIKDNAITDVQIEIAQNITE